MTLLAKAHFIHCRPRSFPRERCVTKIQVDNYQKNILQKGERYMTTHFLYNTDLDVVEWRVEMGPLIQGEAEKMA